MVMARAEHLEYRGNFKELGTVLPSTQLKSGGKTNTAWDGSVHGEVFGGVCMLTVEQTLWKPWLLFSLDSHHRFLN